MVLVARFVVHAVYSSPCCPLRCVRSRAEGGGVTPWKRQPGLPINSAGLRTNPTAKGPGKGSTHSLDSGERPGGGRVFGAELVS